MLPSSSAQQATNYGADDFDDQQQDFIMCFGIQEKEIWATIKAKMEASKKSSSGDCETLYAYFSILFFCRCPGFRFLNSFQCRFYWHLWVAGNSHNVPPSAAPQFNVNSVWGSFQCDDVPFLLFVCLKFFICAWRGRDKISSVIQIFFGSLEKKKDI